MIMTPHLNVKPQSTLTFTRNFIHDTDGKNALSFWQPAA